MPQSKVVIAVACAVAALVAVALTAFYLQPENAAAGSSATAGDARQFEDLLAGRDRELASARAEIAALRAQLGATQPGPAITRDIPAEPKPAEPKPKNKGEEASSLAIDPVPVLRDRALNAQNDPRDRLAALGELRKRNGIDPQVIASMATLARTTTDPKIRADIFRQLHVAKDPILKPLLFEAMQRDASADVRQEAAETLGDYADDPSVQAFLAMTGRSDADLEVRENAIKALVEHAPADRLRQMQSAPQATDLELVHSATALRKLEGANPAQATLLVHVLGATQAPELRKEIVKELGKHYANLPEVTEWMTHLAGNEPDAKVRKEAAKYAK